MEATTKEKAPEQPVIGMSSDGQLLHQGDVVYYNDGDTTQEGCLLLVLPGLFGVVREGMNATMWRKKVFRERLSAVKARLTVERKFIELNDIMWCSAKASFESSLNEYAIQCKMIAKKMDTLWPDGSYARDQKELAEAEHRGFVNGAKEQARWYERHINEQFVEGPGGTKWLQSIIPPAFKRSSGQESIRAYVEHLLLRDKSFDAHVLHDFKQHCSWSVDDMFKGDSRQVGPWRPEVGEEVLVTWVSEEKMSGVGHVICHYLSTDLYAVQFTLPLKDGSYQRFVDRNVPLIRMEPNT